MREKQRDVDDEVEHVTRMMSKPPVFLHKRFYYAN